MLPSFWPRSTITPPTPQTNTAPPAATSSLDKRLNHLAFMVLPPIPIEGFPGLRKTHLS